MNNKRKKGDFRNLTLYISGLLVDLLICILVSKIHVNGALEVEGGDPVQSHYYCSKL